MTKFNIIQRRELEPLMKKANKIVKHYELASNCSVSVMGPQMNLQEVEFDSVCGECKSKKTIDGQRCSCLHMEAVSKARSLGGSYIYICQKGLVFWTSPFYSGERMAGALFSGGIPGTEKNSALVKSLAQMMLVCADQISGMSYIQKNITPQNAGGDDTTGDEIPREANDNDIYFCPLDMERMLLASLRRGDNTEGQKILVKLLEMLYKEVKNYFPAFRLKAMELAVLLSRAASNPKDIEDNTSLDTTCRFLNKIEESSNFKQITDILSSIIEQMSGMIFSFHGVRHFSALRKAERYIWNHYTRKLSLKEIAEASGLSAPYFSTVFKEEMGENLSNYLNRLRVEKAAAMLVTTNMPICEIAGACGFEDQSWFSKIFKNNTGLTPGKYRELGLHAGGTAFGGNVTS
ncbi:MAG: helix-turn-helix domain-containing protein [Treponema sp.]|nr:helix-turn-helix domain-containing protein [Treponema sp.]